MIQLTANLQVKIDVPVLATREDAARFIRHCDNQARLNEMLREEREVIMEELVPRFGDNELNLIEEMINFQRSYALDLFPDEEQDHQPIIENPEDPQLDVEHEHENDPPQEDRPEDQELEAAHPENERLPFQDELLHGLDLLLQENPNLVEENDAICHELLLARQSAQPDLDPLAVPINQETLLQDPYHEVVHNGIGCFEEDHVQEHFHQDYLDLERRLRNVEAECYRNLANNPRMSRVPHCYCCKFNEKPSKRKYAQFNQDHSLGQSQSSSPDRYCFYPQPSDTYY